MLYHANTNDKESSPGHSDRSRTQGKTIFEKWAKRCSVEACRELLSTAPEDHCRLRYKKGRCKRELQMSPLPFSFALRLMYYRDPRRIPDVRPARHYLSQLADEATLPQLGSFENHHYEYSNDEAHTNHYMCDRNKYILWATQARKRHNQIRLRGGWRTS